MCGRFAITLPNDAMAQLFAATPANDLPEVPNYNVCPTTQIHVVRQSETGRRLVPMRWGFLPHWYTKPDSGPLLINARAETIAEKPAFRAACRACRCLIPVSGYYEWTIDKGKMRWPWFIKAHEPLALAGTWQVWDKGDHQVETCAIVTTTANDAMSAIHHRMPVVICPTDWPLWLGEAGHGAANLMQSASDDLLQFHQVDPTVNSNRAHGPHLVEPINPERLLNNSS